MSSYSTKHRSQRLSEPNRFTQRVNSAAVSCLCQVPLPCRRQALVCLVGPSSQALVMTVTGARPSACMMRCFL